MVCAGHFYIIEFDPFWSIGVLRGGVVIREGGAWSHLSLIPYFFESMYRHVYGVKWLPRSVPFEIVNHYRRNEIFM